MVYYKLYTILFRLAEFLRNERLRFSTGSAGLSELGLLDSDS